MLTAIPLCRGAELSLRGPSTIAVGAREQWTAAINACVIARGNQVQFAVDDSTPLRVRPQGAGIGLAPGHVRLTARPVPNGQSPLTLVVYLIP